ncbi:polysaccharide deacetylase [Haloactinopolyspora alba]|uniref:Polysaccharide deacetylase n=1 Tax=Haloactinopolyspora alba TaxID=648780 RepID=A0A2P8DXY7_9ACTN|nr:polysaccharide deacetylase family protein [Haloactinopolyspora alba]PSL02072.1 polysaccharide deacetylase [Haloactinopolyspora alba]
MNNLSWPACILIGVLLGMGFAAADRTVDQREQGTAAGPEAGAGEATPPARADGAGAGDAGGSGDGAPEDGGSGTTGNPNSDYALTLTFDDGPHPTYTPQILDILAEHDATAVFCVVGERVRAHPELVRRTVAEGHALCNHTFSHDDELGRRDQAAVESEISETNAAITAAVGRDVEVPYFRQPNTYVQPRIVSVLDSTGHRPLDWTVDPRDWSQPGTASIVQDVLSEVRPGAIVLLHDGGGDRSQTVAALERILDGLDTAGYRYELPGEGA